MIGLAQTDADVPHNAHRIRSILPVSRPSEPMRLALAAALWLPLAAAAQTPDSTSADSVAASAGSSVSSRRTRPSPNEARLASGAMIGVGVAAGALTAVALPLLSPSTCPDHHIGCDLERVATVAGAVANVGIVGAAGASIYLRGRLGRGSIVGGPLGMAWGAMLGAGLAMALVDESATVSIIVGSVAGGFAGGYAGFRFGPWAKGPGRDQRVALVPVATPNGSGLYAVVRF